YHHDIRIENNHFKVFDAPLVFAKSVEKLSITGNTFELALLESRLPDMSLSNVRRFWSESGPHKCGTPTITRQMKCPWIGLKKIGFPVESSSKLFRIPGSFKFITTWTATKSKTPSSK
ncbi:MAG: hypothetical protein R6U56_00940, partial [Opitutales bacterium]